MSLIYKIKRLIKSDAHALIESLEEPKFVLAQALRDMETDLENQEQEIQNIDSLLKKSKSKIEYFRKNIEKLNQDIEFSFSQDREDLAKNLVRELIKHQKSEVKLNQLIEEEEIKLKSLTQDYEVKKSDLENVKEECSHLNLDLSNEESIWDENQNIIHQSSSLEHEIELEFLKRKQNFEEVQS